MKVMLVFDEAYGHRADRALRDAFWLIDSPVNRALAEQAWATASTDPNSAVFTGRSPATTGDLLAKVRDIDLHHPEWSEITVVGVDPTAELTSTLVTSGFQIELRREEFSIRR